MNVNLSIKFGRKGIIKIATTNKDLLPFQSLVKKNFIFFIPKGNNKSKLNEKNYNNNNSLNNTNTIKEAAKTKQTNKTQALDTTPISKSFSKNMNQNSQSEKEKAEKEKLEQNADKKQKNLEEQKELNISRRSLLKVEKEKNSKSRLNNIEKRNRESYSAEEYNKLILNSKNSEIVFFKISNQEMKYLSSTIKKIIYFILPMTVSGIFFIDFFCYDFKKISTLMKFAYYFLISCDYCLFLFFFFGLTQSSNVVISAKLFPEDNVLELIKFNIFGRLVRIKERVCDMKMSRDKWEPYDSISSKRTNKRYVFEDNKAEIQDKKLFNYLFPDPEVVERKKPSMVDSLWEKN